MLATELYRVGNVLQKAGVPFSAVIFKGLIRLISNCAIDPRTEIGAGSFFAYGGIGVVVHRNCIIGKNVTISQNVTIGMQVASSISEKGLPQIGDDVYIGAGAIVLGNIVVGRGAVIGAGSVVLSSIGEKEVWAGVPAKKIR